MSTTNILQQIQNTLTQKYGQDEALGFGPTFTSGYASSSDSDEDGEVSATQVDAPYITQTPTAPANNNDQPKRTKVTQVKEAEEEKVVDKEKVVDVAPKDDMSNEVPPTGDPGGDMSMAGMGGTGGMDMMGQEEEEEKQPSELGRLYELKKIYSRLTSIEAYLGNESDSRLMEIRNYVSQSIELFEVVSANFNSYKDKLNEIIIMYYKFILEVYESVKGVYRSNSSGD